MHIVEPEPATGEPPGTIPRSLGGAALVAAFVALVLWIAFTWFMVLQSGPAAEVKWTRLAWLFSSVEAVAFGAAGALFGSNIQRQRAEKAEDRAKKNEDDAAKGRALATTLKTEDPATETGALGMEFFAREPAQRAASSVAGKHAAMARTLFPD